MKLKFGQASNVFTLLLYHNSHIFLLPKGTKSFLAKRMNLLLLLLGIVLLVGGILVAAVIIKTVMKILLIIGVVAFIGIVLLALGILI